MPSAAGIVLKKNVHNFEFVGSKLWTVWCQRKDAYLLFYVDVIAMPEHSCTVISVGINLPPHMSISKFGYLVGIITNPCIIAV